MRGLAAAVTAVLLCGCASGAPRIADLALEGTPSRLELESVPFFPQAEYQCGPAALATVLASAGRAVTPRDLVPEVYLPGRRGSLQPELIAATRTRNLLPYPLQPALGDAVAQLASGRPVLVLQNLGSRIFPAWHFAVLVGYDGPANRVVLRSGTTERRVMTAARFDRSWRRAGRWAMVALAPGELPAAPDLDRYLTAAAGLEAVGRHDAARAAYLAARERWADSAWPWLGLGNVSHAAGQLERAQEEYREALARDPANVAARHNLAETLAAAGCTEQAQAAIGAALDAARGSALEAEVEATAARLRSLDADHAAAPCRAPTR